MKPFRILALTLALTLAGAAQADQAARDEAEQLFEVMGMQVTVDQTVTAMIDQQMRQNPGMAPVAPLPVPQVTSPDAAIRSSARVVVNREMARRLPGANVAPYTDCVLQNATSAELASIAAAGAAGAGNAVAAIVGRPATTQCIAGAAAAAKQAA